MSTSGTQAPPYAPPPYARPAGQPGVQPGGQPPPGRRPAVPLPPTAQPELRQFVTPEGVDLRLRIGTGGERASAFLLDFLFVVLILIAFTIVVLVVFMAMGAVGLATEQMGVYMQVVWLLGFFIVRNFYFIVFELSARAATPGKRILGLRVAARDGGRLTAEAVFVRNAMREIEIFLPMQVLFVSLSNAADPLGGWLIVLGLLWTGGLMLFPLFNRDRLRVGDLVAGTWVVKSRRERLSIDLLDAVGAAASQSQFQFSVEQASAYGIKELHVLEDVLRRRDPKTEFAVAERIRGKIAWRRTETETDEGFLIAYYAALRARLETRMLFGHRRQDKFDKG